MKMTTPCPPHFFRLIGGAGLALVAAGLVAALALVDVGAPVVAQSGSEPTASCGTSPLNGRTAKVVAKIVEGLKSEGSLTSAQGCSDATALMLGNLNAAMDFTRTDISQIRAGDFAGLDNVFGVHLSQTHLSSVPSGAFAGLDRVEQISIDVTGVASLPSGLFSGFSRLNTVTLTSNKLTTIPADTFTGSTALRTINLLDNALTSLPSTVFDGLPALSSLNLRGNYLESDDLGFLTSSSSFVTAAPAMTPTLTTLNLSQNLLTHDGTGSDPDLPSGAFSRHTALTTLRLDDNKLRTLPSDAFTGLASLTVLHLNRNRLGTLPSNVFMGLTELQTLQLGQNFLTSVDAAWFTGLTKVRLLTLDTNRLTTLPANVFDSLSALQRLTLSRNRLTELPADVVTGLSALSFLYLSYNPLSSLTVDRFPSRQLVQLEIIETGLDASAIMTLSSVARIVRSERFVFPRTAPFPNRMPELLASCGSGVLDGRTQKLVQYLVAYLQNTGVLSFSEDCSHVTAADLLTITNLDLGSSSIMNVSGLRAGDFQGLTNLTYLSFSYLFDQIKLTSLPSGVFNGLTNLRELNLGYNWLTTLPSDIFDPVPNLVSLSINNNSLTTLPSDIFDSLPNLVTLDLSNNMLTTLPDSVFDELTRLRELELRNNDLTTLQEELFIENTELRAIWLGGNELMTLPLQVFEGLSELRSIGLVPNPLTEIYLGHFAGRGLSKIRLLEVGESQERSTEEQRAAIEAELPSIGLVNWQNSYSLLQPTPVPVFTEPPTATPTATPTPTLEERIELPSVSRVVPVVRVLTVTTGSRIRLSFAVYNAQSSRDDGLLVDKNIAMEWSDGGSGSFAEPRGVGTNSNGMADDREVEYDVPNLPGRYTVTARFAQSWRCNGISSACTATFTVNVQRESVAPTPESTPCPTTGDWPESITQSDGTVYGVVTQAGGGESADGGGSVRVPAGALPGCTAIGVNIGLSGDGTSDMVFNGWSLAGGSYMVGAIDVQTGDVLTSLRLARPANVCVPLPAELRANLVGVNLVRHIGDVVSPLTSSVRVGSSDGMVVCGAVSQLPSVVSAAGPERAGASPTPTVSVVDVPATGGGAPSYAYVILAIALGLVLLTGIGRIFRIIDSQ